MERRWLHKAYWFDRFGIFYTEILLEKGIKRRTIKFTS